MEKIIEQAERLEIKDFLPGLKKLIQSKKMFFDNPSGNAKKYSLALKNLPDINVTNSGCKNNGNPGFNGNQRAGVPILSNLDQETVVVGDESVLTLREKSVLRDALFNLCPWRKGPFNVFGIQIDSEWQSWIKWNRFIDKISPLSNRRILDIGSSNGYYMFRMAARDPFMVLGLEPQHTFYYQYLALQNYLNLKNVFCLPVTFDELPCMDGYFDTIFCMGVLYHRRSPIDMLIKIHEDMVQKGELIVENLVILSDEDICLFPESRYAKMRNVFFIPSLKAMDSWLKRSGFTNIKCIDISTTNSSEQRKTPWIQTESLKDFLDPKDNKKTVEGYPAPVRAVFKANAV